MKNHGSADDLPHGEPVGQKCLKGPAPVPEQGRQIPGVMGVGIVVRIVMGQRPGKGIPLFPAALGSAVNMECKNPFLTRIL